MNCQRNLLACARLKGTSLCRISGWIGLFFFSLYSFTGIFLHGEHLCTEAVSHTPALCGPVIDQ